MFINQLHERSHKLLFMEIVVLFAILDSNKIVELPSSPYMKIKLKDVIEESKVSPLKEYENEGKYSGLFEKAIESSSMDTLWKETLEKVTNDLSDNPVFLISIFDGIKSAGGGINNINSEVMMAAMINESYVKNSVIKEMLRRLILVRKKEGISFSYSEGKIFLFELVGFCVQHSVFDEVKKDILQKVCEVFGLDSEYIDEFARAITRFLDANQEIHVLINE